jgi:protein-disulfide isomerase
MIRRFACLALLAAAACSHTPDVTNGTMPTAQVTGAKPPAGQDWTQVVSETPDGGYRMGNPNAPLKLVEYGSRTCPTCGRFGREGMEPLENGYVKTGKVSYEFREYLVHGSPDLPPAILGRCVGTAAFFPVLEAMYQGQDQFEQKLMDQNATSALEQKLQGAPPPQVAQAWADYMGYVDFMKQRGLPEAKARACLSDQKGIDRIIQVMNDAQQNKDVTSTPTFILNGQKLDVAGWDQLEPALKQAGA